MNQNTEQLNNDARTEKKLRDFFRNRSLLKNATPSTELRARILAKAKSELEPTPSRFFIASPYFRHSSAFNLSLAGSLAALVLVIGGTWTFRSANPPASEPEHITAQSRNAEIDSLAIEEMLDTDTSLPPAPTESDHRYGEQFELSIDEI